MAQRTTGVLVWPLARMCGRSSPRLQELKGREEHRIGVLATESDVHPRLIRLALEYAAAHPLQIRERINRNRDAIARSRAGTRERKALLAA